MKTNTLELDKDLLNACTKDDLEKIKKLIADGANINCKNKTGYTPLLLAVLYHAKRELFELLMDNGADINFKNNCGRDALYIAVNVQNLETLKILISMGANINTQDDNGVSPLYIACCKGNLEVIKYLIDRGADFKIVNKKNENLIDSLLSDIKDGTISASMEQIDIINYLKNIGIEPDIKNKNYKILIKESINNKTKTNIARKEKIVVASKETESGGIPWIFIAVIAGGIFAYTKRDMIFEGGGFIVIIGAIVLGVISANRMSGN